MTHYSTVGTTRQVVNITAHGFVVVHNQRTVTVLVVIHKRQDDERAAPFGRIVEEIAERNILRSRGGNHAVGFLGVHYILNDFGNIGAHVVVVKQRRTVQMVLFQPTQLLAVGTIGQHGLHIRPLCPLYKPVRLGEKFVTAFETRHLGGGIIHETTLQLVQDRQSVGIGLPFPHCSFHLDIAETVVGKSWVIGDGCWVMVEGER